MTKTIVFDVTNESILMMAEYIREAHRDSMLVLAPISGDFSVHSPAKKGKKKGYHRLKFEVLISEDSIVGDDALIDIGLTTLLRIPKNRVAAHLKRE